MPESRTALIVGDWIKRTDLYRGHPAPQPTLLADSVATPDLPTLIRLAAARSASARTEKASESEGSNLPDGPLEIVATDSTASPQPLTERFALWEPCAHQGTPQWRCVEHLGSRPLPTPPLPTTSFERPSTGVLVIDDAGADPRIDPLPNLGPHHLAAGQVLYRLSQPRAPGPCWQRVIRHAADRTTLILDADSLRAANVRISHGSSWERTATDTLREARDNPELTWLRRPRHVLIRFDLEGVLHLTFSHGGQLENARLLYDPDAAEGSHRDAIEGDVTDLDTAFLAGLTLHADAGTVAGSLTPGSLAAGMQTGLRAARALHAHGHGSAADAPSYPLEPVTHALLGQEEALPLVKVPTDVDDGKTAPSWTILAGQVTSAESTAPLFDLAHRLAVGGLDNTWAVPHTQLGSYLTVDRSEIEGLAALRQLLQSYQQMTTTEPLGIGLFGPPGAGKTFVARQLASALLNAQPLEFNLSQFAGPADILSALRQTRDAVLRGALPVILFEEFDTDDFRWLKHLLAPLRHGQFQDGGVHHATGKCVFLFAGSSAWTHQAFGIAGRKNLWAPSFVSARGPEFKGSLAAHLNLLGPNPKVIETKDPSEAQARPHKHIDPDDISFPLRRALALRSHLHGEDAGHLEIDSDLLDLLLRARTYRSGHRSLRQIAHQLRSARPRGPFPRSCLPTRELLDPHLDADLDQSAQRSTSRTTHRLAFALAGFAHSDRDTQHHREFAKLPRQVQADHFAAAHRISMTIQDGGMFLASGDSPAAMPLQQLRDLLEQSIEQVAASEHDRRLEYRLHCGWRYGPRAAAAATQLLQIQHDTLIPYPRLTEEDKELERIAVRRYVDVIHLAGFSVVRPVTKKKKAKAKPKAKSSDQQTANGA